MLWSDFNNFWVFCDASGYFKKQYSLGGHWRKKIYFFLLEQVDWVVLKPALVGKDSDSPMSHSFSVWSSLFSPSVFINICCWFGYVINPWRVFITSYYRLLVATSAQQLHLCVLSVSWTVRLHITEVKNGFSSPWKSISWWEG